MTANISQALVDLLNKTEPGRICFAFAVPTRVLRVTADLAFCAFRVERLRMHNKDQFNPRGAWQTISAHCDSPPGAKLGEAMGRLITEQNNLRASLSKRIAKRAAG